MKPQIDHVLALTDVSALIEYARDISCPPEARLLAAAKLEAIFSLAATDRRVRPDVDLAKVRAIVAGLGEGSIWRSPWSYGCICDGSISHDGGACQKCANIRSTILSCVAEMVAEPSGTPSPNPRSGVMDIDELEAAILALHLEARARLARHFTPQALRRARDDERNDALMRMAVG